MTCFIVWEENNNLLPPRARRWWYKHNDDEEPAPETKKRTLEQIEGQRKKRKQLATEAASAQQTMTDSSEMLQTCLQLLPAPDTLSDPIHPKVPNAPWACEACTYFPNTGEHCDICTNPRNNDQPQHHRSDEVEHCRPLLFKGNPWECTACKYHLNESDNCDKCEKPKGRAMTDSSELVQACLQLLPATGPDPPEKRNPSRPGTQPNTIWTLADVDEEETPPKPTSPTLQRGKKRKTTIRSPIQTKKRPATAPRAQTPFWDLRQGKRTHTKETTHNIRLWQCKNCTYKLNTTTRCARCPEDIEYSEDKENTQIPPQDPPLNDIPPEPPP